MRTTRPRTAAGAIGSLALLLAVTACSSDGSSGEALPDAAVETTVGATEPPATDSPTDSPTETTAAPIEEGTGNDDPPTGDAAAAVPEALQFTAPLVGGGTFDGAAQAGKPTVFWFWAPT